MTSRSNLVSVTRGMANTLTRGRNPSRICSKCGRGVPAYPGRYPTKCPYCEGKLNRCTEEVLQSLAPRLRLVMEAGIRAGVPWAGDEACSPAVCIPINVVEALLPGGMNELTSMMEGPTESGRYFRVEDPWSPVLIAEIDEAHNSVSVYASDAPARWIGSDPREAMIEDGGWTVEGWEDLDEYAGTVDGRVVSPDGEKLSDDFLAELRSWVQRYARKGALIKGEPEPDKVELIIPVYSMAQMELADIGQRNGVDVEIGLFDANTGIRWHPLRGTCEGAREAMRESRKVHPAAFDARDRYHSDMEAGHDDAAEYWKGQAAGLFLIDPEYELSEKADDGTETCGVFIPLPKRVLSAFPERPAEDQSDPHITICYLGGLTKEQYGTAARVLEQVCAGMRPFVIEMTDYGEFVAAKGPAPDEGMTVAHMIPRVVGGPTFEEIHERLVCAFREAGLPVTHHRDNAFKPHVTLAYLKQGEKYSGPRPQGYWRCENLELWGAGLWLDGELGRTVVNLGTGNSHYLDEDAKAGGPGMSSVTRARVIRPVPGYGDDGQATRAHGGFRFQIGHNRRRKPNKNVMLSIQNRKNAQRGLAARIKAAKDWHASPVGKRYHSALNRYNRGNHKGNQLTMPGKGGSPSAYSGALAEEYAAIVQNLDDAFDALLRKLIRIESLDVLQDVDFDEDNGAIYLYFDPLLTRDEIELILAILKEENSMATIVGSPTRVLPGEFVEADWWVVWAPYREASDGQSLVPDPRYYAIDPSARSKGAPAPQTFVKPATTSVDTIAQKVDVSQLVQAIGESVRPTADGQLMIFWSDQHQRTPQLKGIASGVAGEMLPQLVEASAQGQGALFLIRGANAQDAREAISRGNLGRLGHIWTNDREMTR